MTNCVTNRNDKWRARQPRCSQCRAPICRTCAAIVAHRSPGSVAPMAEDHTCLTQEAQGDSSKPRQARVLLCATCSKEPAVGAPTPGEARPRRRATTDTAPSEGENLFSALFERRQTKARENTDDSENPFKVLLESRKTRTRMRTSSANLLGLGERLDRTLNVSKVSETARRNAHHHRQEAAMARSTNGHQAIDAETPYHRSQHFKNDSHAHELQQVGAQTHPKVRPRRHTTSTLSLSTSAAPSYKTQTSSEEEEDEEIRQIAKWSARRRMERAMSTPGGGLPVVDLSYLSDFK